MQKKIDWLPSEKVCRCPKHALNCLSEDEWLKRQPPVWSFKQNEIKGDFEHNSRHAHPATFPRALALRLIELYTHKGETVLDCFSGVGTTLVSALQLGRFAVGIELNPRYIKLARLRLSYMKSIDKNNPDTTLNSVSLRADARDLIKLIPSASIDLVLTSPPYWDLLKQRQSSRNRKSGKYLKENYSSSRSDLSNLTTLEQFLSAMNEIFVQIKHVLKVGGRFVLITGDYRRRGRYIPLHSIYIRNIENLGLRLNNIIFWNRSNEYDIGLFSYPDRFTAANGMVEYILEFMKE